MASVRCEPCGRVHTREDVVCRNLVDFQPAWSGAFSLSGLSQTNCHSKRSEESARFSANKTTKDCINLR